MSFDPGKTACSGMGYATHEKEHEATGKVESASHSTKKYFDILVSKTWLLT